MSGGFAEALLVGPSVFRSPGNAALYVRNVMKSRRRSYIDPTPSTDGNSPESVSRDTLGNQKKLLARDDNMKKWVKFNKNTTQRERKIARWLAEKSCKEKIRTFNCQKRRSRGCTWVSRFFLMRKSFPLLPLLRRDDDFMKRDHLLITSSGITSVWSGL